MISLKWDIKLESAVDKTELCFKPKIVMLMLKFSPEQLFNFLSNELKELLCRSEPSGLHPPA